MAIPEGDAALAGFRIVQLMLPGSAAAAAAGVGLVAGVAGIQLDGIVSHLLFHGNRPLENVDTFIYLVA